MTLYLVEEKKVSMDGRFGSVGVGTMGLLWMLLDTSYTSSSSSLGASSCIPQLHSCSAVSSSRC